MDGLIQKGTHITDSVGLTCVPLPLRTNTYQPVGHLELVDLVKDISTQTITGYRLNDEQYALSKEGAEMFGQISFVPIDENISTAGRSMDLAIGVVNSYNKRVRVKFASGAKVLASNTLVLLGDVTYTRKHTPNVLVDVRTAISDALSLAKSAYETAKTDSIAMRYVETTNEQAFALLGVLFGQGVFNTPQLNIALKEWKSPSYISFQERNLWSLYNAASIALKTSSPDKCMEKHIGLHDLFVNFAKHRIAI